MFLGVRLKKMCGFVNLLLKYNIYVISSRFKEFKYSKNDILSFLKNLLNIEIFCLLMFGSIVVKMDNFHLFEKVLIFLFHTMKQWVMKFINNMVCFFTCTCVLMLLCILS